MIERPINANNRKYTDRRAIDRRNICVEIVTKADFRTASKEINRYEILEQIFPNLKIMNHRLPSERTSIIDWRLVIDDGHIDIQTEIKTDSSGRFINFIQLNGDLQKFFGKISLSPHENGTKISAAVFIEPGLPSFEAILGELFKNRFSQLIEDGLRRLAQKLGGIVEKTSHFGFLIHTIPDYFSSAFSDKTYDKMPSVLFENLMRNFPPFKSAHVSGIKSLTGESVEGSLIFCPYTPSHFLKLKKDVLLNSIVEAGLIAKDLGAKILGLGAYTAFVGKRGIDVAKMLDMPVTTGTSYTIAMALQALEAAALKTDLLLQESTVTIVGATGSIGKICAELLAPKTKKLILVARNITRLNDLHQNLQYGNKGKEINSTSDLKAAVDESDLILLSTNTPEIIIDVRSFKPGSIICDISQPRNISFDDASTREDILVIDGGVVEPPGKPDFNIYFGLPPGHTYACLAETMILALDKKFESFSIGGNITAEKVKEIQAMGKKHGFKLSDLKSFSKIINEIRFEKISIARKIKNGIRQSK